MDLVSSGVEVETSNSSTDAFFHLALTDVAGKGRAVIAKSLIAKGCEVLEFLGKKRHVSDLGDLTHALQIGPVTYLESSGLIDDFVNHSCRPNSGIRQDSKGRVILFALRSIEQGEEITFDYATTQSGGHSAMECLCGELSCRGLIGDFDDLPLSLRQFYVSQDAVLSYLLK